MVEINYDAKLLVSLVTLDKDIEDLIIKEYPRIITGEQHEERKIGYRRKLYIFKDLFLGELVEFINAHNIKNYRFTTK